MIMSRAETFYEGWVLVPFFGAALPVGDGAPRQRVAFRDLCLVVSCEM